MFMDLNFHRRSVVQKSRSQLRLRLTVLEHKLANSLIWI